MQSVNEKQMNWYAGRVVGAQILISCGHAASMTARLSDVAW